MNYTLEIIGFTLEGCLTAEACGAHRLELCDNPAGGGTTPSYGFVKAARQKVNMPLYPIIRPRSGDFFFSKAEFDMMKSDILVCKQLGCDGVVIGMLNADATIDKESCSKLVMLAYPMGVTFHRAFDRVADASKALEDIIDIGCERVLTSGSMPQALNGISTISGLIEQAANRIIIMPGSGIRSVNIGTIAGKTGATEFHSSASKLLDSRMEFNPAGMNEKLQTHSTDAVEIKKMLSVLENL